VRASSAGDRDKGSFRCSGFGAGDKVSAHVYPLSTLDEAPSWVRFQLHVDLLHTLLTKPIKNILEPPLVLPQMKVLKTILGCFDGRLLLGQFLLAESWQMDQVQSDEVRVK
jgi:hypothetical protein